MADALPAINHEGRDTDPIVKDDAHNASIMSDKTQDFNTTFQTQDYTAKPLESSSKISEAAKPTSNSESHVDILHSIVNGVSDSNTTDRSSVTATSVSATESVPLTNEHTQEATQPHPFEEHQLQATAESQHGDTDAEENPIDAFYNTSSELLAPAADPSEADKGFIVAILQNQDDSVKAVEEIPVKADENAIPILDAQAHVTLAGEATDHPDVVVTEDEPSGFGNTSDTIAEPLIARSEPVDVVSDTPTPETEQEEMKDGGSTTTHAIKHAEEAAPATSEGAVDRQLSVGEEISIESLAKGDITSVTPELTAEHVTEATDGKASHILDESTMSHEPHFVDEVSIPAAKEIQESLSHAAEPPSLAPAVVTFHAIEATDPFNINQESVAPNTTIDIPTPASDDTAVHERVAEPQEVRDMERVGSPTSAVEDTALVVEQAKHGPNSSAEITTTDEPHTVTEPHSEGLIDVSTPEMKSVDDGPTVVEPAELEPAVLPKETAGNTTEERALSGSEVPEGSSSDLASTGEVPAPVSEAADAAVHSPLKEAVSVDDVDPVARGMLHSDESSEEPVPSTQIAHDTIAATNSESIESADPIITEVFASVEPSEGVVPSANPHAQESSESTLVESLPVESVKVEEVKRAEEGVADVEEIQEESIIEKAVTEHEASRKVTLPEAIDEPRTSNQDDHPEERPSAMVDAGLPSEEVKSSETKTNLEAVEEKKAVETIAEERAFNDQSAAMGPAAGEPSSEGPTPAGEFIVEQEVSDITDAVASIPESRTAEDTVTASEPIYVSQEAETVPTQKDTEETALETDSSPSTEKDTPVQSSSEQPEFDHVQEHTDPEVVDELPVHEITESPDVQEAVIGETPVVDVDSDVSAEGLVKEESTHPEGNQIVKVPSAPANPEDDTNDLSLEQGVVEEIVIASGPIRVAQETFFVDTVPAQQDTKDAPPEINPLPSVGETTPAQPSSELPLLDDAQSHVHSEAETVDELQKGPEKEESITDGEQLVEPLVDELVSMTSVKQEIQQAGPSTDDASAPEMSNETKVVEGIASTPEDAATDAKSIAEVVSSIQDAPVVPEDEIQPVPTEDVPSTLAESLTEDQPNLQPIAGSQAEEVFAPLVEVTKEPEATQEVAVPVTQEEIVEGGIEDTSSTVVEKDIARAAEIQQPTAEHNDLEEATFTAQQAPVIDEEMAASVPNAQVLTSPDDLVYANQAIDSDAGKIIDEPIAPVLIVAPSESLLNSIPVEVASTSEEDRLKMAEAETERPKSPWTSSFQVTTVGRGVSDLIEDEQPEAQGSTVLGVNLILDENADESQKVTPAIEVAHAPDNTSQIYQPTPQLAVDMSSLDTSVEPARPWTPSYSVHSQGSPHDSPIVIGQESSVVLRDAGEQGLEVNIPELPELKSADEEKTSVSNNLGFLEPATTHLFDAADESTLPGTDIADLAVVKDVSESEAQVLGPEEKELAGTLETLAEVDAPTHATETRDMECEPEEVPQIPTFVVDELTEVSVQLEGDGAQLLNPPSESLPERVVSSPWVPSYSISRQGSPLLPSVDLPEEVPSALDALDCDDVSPVGESPNVLAFSQASVEDSVKILDSVPQTYDETVEVFPEPANLTENALPPFITVNDVNHGEQVGDLVESGLTDLIVVIDGGENKTQEDTEPPHSSVTSDAEQPKSPWTPSYSVTVQGSEMIDGEQRHLEPLSRRDVEDEATQDANIDRSNIPDTYEPERTVTQSEESGLGLTTIAQAGLSVPAQQSTPLHVEADSGSPDPSAQESASLVEQTQRAATSQVPRLEPVGDAPNVENASPATRRRHDSTASRFIPGVWPSTASKVVNEGRTSLEIAQGEFIPSKPTSPVEELSDSSVSDHDSSTDDDSETEEEKKKGWCVVM